MLIYSSIILIVLLTTYVIYFTYQRRERLTCMTGMMIAMTNSMMVSISLGAILGTFIENKDLTIPTIASVLIGMVTGYATGRPVSPMAALDGLTAGIMGGMMGSMLGVMLQSSSINLMIYFIDIIFALVMVFLLRLIDEESKAADREKAQYRKPLIANPILLVVILAFMGTLVFGKGLFIPGQSEVTGQTKDKKITPASNEIHEIQVKPTEYAPNNIVLKAGTSAVLNFKTEKVGCTGIIVSDELGFNVSLKENTDNYVNVKSLKPGTYHYSCGMGMYKGTVTVN
ncbi:putative membrane protein YfcA [Neobacillus sp. B4I6]|uniref:cupredoxin domain-containing protein n=1 Tax=Neobacillus sp. B4I6 TaxID=3373925 RepID=UPI003D1FAA5B